MKVIFLDIDGVMNSNVFYDQKHNTIWRIPTTYYYKLRYVIRYVFNGFKPKYTTLKFDTSEKHREKLFSYDYAFKRLKSETDPIKWKWLSNTCNTYDYKICISSVWKHTFKHPNDWNRALTELGFKPNTFVGITGNKKSIRGHEINDWIKKHKDTEAYAIIDDDSDMLPKQSKSFFFVDRWYGLTPNILDKINKHFGNNENQS